MNLDCMTETDLHSFERDANERAVLSRGADSQTWRALASYAGKKRGAMILRRGGYIASASQLEADCDALYERLPESVRW